VKTVDAIMSLVHLLFRLWLVLRVAVAWCHEGPIDQRWLRNTLALVVLSI
jgi:hypothetical protein